MKMSDSSDPASFNFPPSDALGPDKMDNLGRALLSLTREVCVLTDRQVVLEHLLNEAGVVVGDAIDQLQPDAALQAKIDARTAAIVKSVLGELIGE